MKRKFTAEIITARQPIVSHEPARGYGAAAVATRLSARVQEITIAIDGSPALVLNIDEAGNVHLTNCFGMFEHLIGSTLQLRNTRPWKG